MNETKEQLQAIIDGAPDVANAVSNAGYKNFNSGNSWFAPNGVDLSTLEYGWHCLSDLRDKLALMEEKYALEAKIADLTSQVENLAEIRAKAVEDFVADFMDRHSILHLDSDSCCCQVLIRANGYANNIRNGKE